MRIDFKLESIFSVDGDGGIPGSSAIQWMGIIDFLLKISIAYVFLYLSTAFLSWMMHWGYFYSLVKFVCSFLKTMCLDWMFLN